MNSDKKRTMENVIAIAVVIAIAGISVSSVSMAQVPWYVTAIGTVTGGIIGSLTGSPIGTIAGATAGALVSNYLYQIFNSHNSQQAINANTIKLAKQYALNYENMTSSDLVSHRNVDNSIINLSKEAYYYGAQQEEAIAPYYLNQSTLSLFNVSMASGEYATLNNISEALFQPIQIILYDTFSTANGSHNQYFTNDVNSSFFYSYFDGYSQVGTQLIAGDIIFLPHNTQYTLFRVNNNQNIIINVQNIFTGKNYTISSTLYNGYNYLPIYSNVTNGWYKILNITGTVLTGGIEIKPNGYILSNSSNYQYLMNTFHNTQFTFTSWNAFLMNTSLPSGPAEFGFTSAFNNTSAGSYSEAEYTIWFGVNNSNIFTGLPDYYTTLNDTLINTYTAANSYFELLKTQGYTNITQIPPDLIYPFPSDVIPSSMLNGVFNSSQLLELYIGYLNDLNRTFHNSSLFNGHNYTKTVIQNEFVNGFLTVYGNLQYTNDNKTTYLNHTDFFIQTYDKNLLFTVGKTTELTGEIYPVLVLNGTENGTLLYVDASIYVIGLSLAGKNISSYELMPVTISYVISKGFSAPPISSGSLFISVGNFLAKYYIIVTLILLAVVAVTVYSYANNNNNKRRSKKE